MYLIESTRRKNRTWITWTVVIYVIKNKHTIILHERNEFYIVRNKVWKQVYVFDWNYFEQCLFTYLYFLIFGLNKVAPRVEKTEVFKKGWNFASCFAACIIKKGFFLLLWRKETAFFLHFHHEIIFYSAELFECAFNFKFC